MSEYGNDMDDFIYKLSLNTETVEFSIKPDGGNPGSIYRFDSEVVAHAIKTEKDELTRLQAENERMLKALNYSLNYINDPDDDLYKLIKAIIDNRRSV